MKARVVMSLLAAIALVVIALGSASTVHADPIDTAFTYRGRLVYGGVPANGLYDFEFRLYATYIGYIGPIERKGAVNVTDGNFTVRLDFGDVFDGTQLWLEASVRPASSDPFAPFTPLLPAQELTASPYASYALRTPWSGLSGLPAGFANLAAGCAAGQVLKWDGSSWACGDASGAAYTAGAGLTLSSGQFSLADGGITSVKIADGSVTFADLSLNGCTNGQVPKSNGITWTCGQDNANVYTAGAGLSLVGGAFSIADKGVSSAKIQDQAIQSNALAPYSVWFQHWGSNMCGNGEIPRYNGTIWGCYRISATDVQDGTLSSARGGTGLNTIGTNGQVLKSNGASLFWGEDNGNAYSAGSGITISSGAIGLADSGVASAKIADGAVTSAKIADGAVTFADLSLNACASSQVPKSSGTAWTCSSDTDTTYTAGAGLALASGQFSIANGGVLPLANGGTGSSTKSFVDLTSAQSVGGIKTFTSAPAFTSVSVPFSVTTNGMVANLNADYVDGVHAAGFQKHYQNVVVVAKSGGDYTTISAALLGISDASETNPYLVRVSPGVYSERVIMKPWVDIEGAGEKATKITYVGDSANTNGTVLTADNAELRFLTVENTGGASYAIAIVNNGYSPRITHVTATARDGTLDDRAVANYLASPILTDVTAVASGGSNTKYGMYNYSSAPVLRRVSIKVSGGATNFGIYSDACSSPFTFTDVDVTVSDGTGTRYGIYNTSSSPTMRGMAISVSGGANAYGVYNISSMPAIMDTTVLAFGASGVNTGVHNNSSSTTLTNVTTTGSGGQSTYGLYNSASQPVVMGSMLRGVSGSVSNYGMYSVGSGSTILVNNSRLIGSTGTLYGAVGTVTRVGASQLDGGPAASSGTLTCAGVYNAAYAFFASTCP